MLHFDAVLNIGVVRLALPGSDERHDAVSHALALRAHWPLLEAIEACLGETLDPVPAAPRDADRDAVVLRIATGGSLSVPIAALRAPLPATWRDAGTLLWPMWPCEVRLDAVPSGRVSQAELHPGCVLLLPRSFAPAWSASVHAQPPIAIGARAAQWHAEKHRLELPPAPAEPDASPRDDDWQVVLAAQPALSAEHLLSLAPDAAFWSPAPGEDTVMLRRHGRRVATGRLLAAGRGVGLRLDAVVADAPVPA
jgi:hypothetical protein